MEWVKGDSARPGSVFRGHNRNGSRQWSTTCTVTDAHAGKVFGFDVKYAIVPIAHWQYEISTAEPGHCTVTEHVGREAGLVQSGSQSSPPAYRTEVGERRP